MKTILTLSLAFLLCFSGYTQEKKDSKSIEVKGTAEKEIIPDIIYFRLTLKEYKDGSKKKSINQLEEELVKAVAKVNIPKEHLQVENIYGYNWDHKKKQSDEFLATKSFLIKLNDLKQINNLLMQLDAEGINNSNVSNYTHSKLEEYKMQLKIEALKQAKEKANALLSAIGENLGDALEIQEIEYGRPQPVYARNAMANSEVSSYQSDLEFKTIKLTAEIRAVFAIE